MNLSLYTLKPPSINLAAFLGFCSLFSIASSNSKELYMRLLGVFTEEKYFRAEYRTDSWLHMNNLFQKIRFKCYCSDKMKTFQDLPYLDPGLLC